jgi:hypothetical protein
MRMNDFLSYTQPPADVVMPAAAQLITTTIYGVGAVVFVIYAIYLANRYRSMLPILFICGALLTIYLEPFVDVMGNALHPQIGQLNLLTTNGHPVPWAVLIGYVWYFAGALLICYKKIEDRSITPTFLWIIYAAVVIGAAIVEQIPLYYGVWIYYGYQPHKIGFMPMWWVFANTAAVLVPFIIIYKIFPLLKGWKQLFVLGLMPSAAFMGHTAAGWPMYNALGTNTETFPHIIIQFASICAMALSILTVWAMIKVAGIGEAER